MSPFLLRLLLGISMGVFLGNTVLAQTTSLDSSGLKLVRITHADSVVGYQTEERKYQSLLGAVVIEHDGIIMTCDSAHLYREQNRVEAFSNVQVVKANGTQATAQYMHYTGNNNTAFMRGGVQIIDGGNTLQTEELTYNLKTKIGKYTNGGTLQKEETTVSSKIGNYNGFSSQAYFLEDVVITNPKYSIQSKELTYNTKTDVLKFLDQSEIVSENSTIQTKAGTYNSKTGAAVFTSRTRIENEDQIIDADYIDYNDKTASANARGKVRIEDVKNKSVIFSDKAFYNKTLGDGFADGNVFILREEGKNKLWCNHVDYNKKNGYVKATVQVKVVDTAEHTELRAGQVEFNENASFMLASKKPKLITVNDGDSTFMRSDTMITMRERDTAFIKVISIGKDAKTKLDLYGYNLLYADSTFKEENDSTAPKLLLAYRMVKLFSDSMQVVCDSLRYLESDSVFRLYRNPVLWSKKQQAHADTVFIRTQQSKIEEAHLRGNSLLISDHELETMYDQISGNYIDAEFKDNQLYRVFVNQNAESLYFAQDDEKAYIGMNTAESSSMTIYLQNQTLDRITMHENPKGSTIPMEQVNASNKFLTTFQLFTQRKPKSKEDILID
jgi:lipopolysaccharide export system protein LptA